MALINEMLSAILPSFSRHSKPKEEEPQRSETGKVGPPSKIQTIPAELMLLILEKAPDVLAVKNLLLACPSFYPIYCGNRYKVLLKVLLKSMGPVTTIWAMVALDLHKLDRTTPCCREKARRRFRAGRRMVWNHDRTDFFKAKPSLSDLVEVAKMHCWVLQKAEEYTRAASEPNLINYFTEAGVIQDLHTFLYFIEIFAFLVGEKDRGWAAASLPKSGWERALLRMWDTNDIESMSRIVKVIWPDRFGKTPPRRRRTRVLLVRSARTRRFTNNFFR